MGYGYENTTSLEITNLDCIVSKLQRRNCVGVGEMLSVEKTK